MREQTHSRFHDAWFRYAAFTTMLAALGGCASEISDPQPPDAVFPTAITITAGEDTASYFVRNIGGAPLDWSATSLVGWLLVQPVSGTVTGGDSMHVMIQADTAVLNAGVTVADVGIVTNAFSESETLQVEVHVAPAPTLSFLDGDTIRVYPEREGRIAVIAGGKGLLNYEASSDTEWLRVAYNMSGTLSPGGITDIFYEIDPWPVGDTTVHIMIASNDAASPLRVPIHVAALPAPSYAMLPHDVTDAAFDAAHQHVVVVHEQTLTRIHVPTQSVQSLTLPFPARNVDVGSARAVVGHDGSITIVDLNTMAVITTLTTGVDARDVAFGHVYYDFALVIPDDVPHARYLRIALDDLAVDTVDAPDQPPLLRFADGGFQYAVLDDGSIASISDADALSFSGFFPSAIYAPGDMRLWDMGARAITSAARMYDLTEWNVWEYYGSIDWEGAPNPPAIRWAHQGGTSNDLLCILPEPASSVIVLWDYYSFTARVTHMPPVVIDGNTLTVDPRYVWCGANREAVVLQRAVTSGSDGPWLLGVVAH